MELGLFVLACVKGPEEDVARAVGGQRWDPDAAEEMVPIGGQSDTDLFEVLESESSQVVVAQVSLCKLHVSAVPKFMRIALVGS